MSTQAHGIAMAVESLYLSHSSAAVTSTLLDLESCFAAIDDKMVRPQDYYSLLQVCSRCASLCLWYAFRSLYAALPGVHVTIACV